MFVVWALRRCMKTAKVTDSSKLSRSLRKRRRIDNVNPGYVLSRTFINYVYSLIPRHCKFATFYEQKHQG